jgi:hypothetical protein
MHSRDSLFGAKPPTPPRHMRQKGLRHKLSLRRPLLAREQRTRRTIAQIGLKRRDLIVINAPRTIAPRCQTGKLRLKILSRVFPPQRAWPADMGLQIQPLPQASKGLYGRVAQIKIGLGFGKTGIDPAKRVGTGQPAQRAPIDNGDLRSKILASQSRAGPDDSRSHDHNFCGCRHIRPLLTCAFASPSSHGTFPPCVGSKFHPRQDKMITRRR